MRRAVSLHRRAARVYGQEGGPLPILPVNLRALPQSSSLARPATSRVLSDPALIGMPSRPSLVMVLDDWSKTLRSYSRSPSTHLRATGP